MENRVGHLQPVAVDLDVIKKQQDELRPLAKEYRDASITIDKVTYWFSFLLRTYLYETTFNL